MHRSRFDQLRVIPANEAACHDLQLVFGDRGTGYVCQCQRYKLAPKESFGSVPRRDRMLRLWEQTECGNPASAETTGLVGYLGDDPVAWCAVEPRSDYPGLLRVFKVPWEGRIEDRSDPTVWAITCLYTRRGYRRQGISGEMAGAAVEFARSRGARAVEAYPITVKNVIDEELHVGTPATFAAAGLVEVSHPTKRRAVMRMDF